LDFIYHLENREGKKERRGRQGEGRERKEEEEKGRGKRGEERGGKRVLMRNYFQERQTA
jgi:hypothetical protein